MTAREAQVGGDTSQDVTTRPSRRARRSAWSGKNACQRKLLRNAGSAFLLLIIVAFLWPVHLGGVTGLTVVQGQSMEPTYVTGDVVMTLKQTHYAVGDVISYRVSEGQPGAGGRVIHRVIEVQETADGTIYLTQGDNNPEVDPWAVHRSDIMGRALWHIPGLGQVLGAGSYPLIVAGAAAVIVLVFLWPTAKRDDDETATEQ